MVLAVHEEPADAVRAAGQGVWCTEDVAGTGEVT